MDQDLRLRLIYELKLLKKAEAECAEILFRLGPATDMKLKISFKSKSNCYYQAKSDGPGPYKYVGKEDGNPIISKIKEAAHILQAREWIGKNIELIEALLDGYHAYDQRTIDDYLPDSYKTTPQSVYASKYQLIGQKWKADNLVFQAGFPENYPEHKTEPTSDGVMVKSVSEVVIYERLLSSGLTFVYELPLVSKDYGPNLYPDFSVLSPIDCKSVIIVEYAGKLNTPNYREDFARRVHRYILNGYIPGVNLFFIFGDKNGHVDSLQVNKVIADIMGLR